MNKTVVLRNSRDLLLKLHKALVDFERESYVTFNGPVTSGQFLNQLLENSDFAWLRKFSMLIVDIDEMFAQKDGYSGEAVDVHLIMMERIISMTEADDYFRAKYEMALQGDSEAAALHAELKSVLQYKDSQ